MPFQAQSGSYIITAILFAFSAAVIVTILYTTAIVSNIYYTIFAVLLSMVIVALFIYEGASSRVTSLPPVAPPVIKDTQDAFTYDPGETSTGVVSFSGNAAAIPDQYSCKLKSANSVYEDAQCHCKTGYYGRSCEYEGFDENYVSLTADIQPTLTALPSITTDVLSTWPTGSTSAGCTNICTSNPACLAVTYANKVCTQYSTVVFPKVPIQTTLDPPILDTTLYINKNRILSVKLQGYFDIIYGVLPPRYFVGNGISSGTDTNIHITQGGSRIGYYAAGIQSTFTGIPDWIIVGTTGTLYISPNRIPEPSSVVPGQGTLVALTAPLRLSKSQFPYSQINTVYYVRLDP